MSTPAIPTIPLGNDEPSALERARRFSAVAVLAARIYAGYKAAQLWTRFISDTNKAEIYRRQDLRAVAAQLERGLQALVQQPPSLPA